MQIVICRYVYAYTVCCVDYLKERGNVLSMDAHVHAICTYYVLPI